MSPALVLKLVLVPSLIWGVTLAGRRWGPAIAGWLSAFPLISAPILLFIALDHGAAFAAGAALGTLSAVLANVAFGVGYAWSAARFRLPWAPSLAIGFAGYLLAVACLGLVALSLSLAVPLVSVALLVAPRLYPSASTAPSSQGSPRPAGDVAWRMGAALVLVLLVTYFSAALGPRLSGSLAMFPVMASVLAVFSHRHSGPAYAVQLLRGMVLGYYAFGVFCISLILALPATGIGPAFLIALACAVLVQAMSRIHLKRAPPFVVSGHLRPVSPPPPVVNEGR